MRVLLEQLENSLDSALYYLSLFTALTIPDIAGAIDSEDGQANGDRYRAWYEAWIRPRFAEGLIAEVGPQAAPYISELQNLLDGEACYRFRCSLLHQGSSQHPKSSFSRIIFIEPGTTTNVIHYCTTNDALCIDVERFWREVIAGTRLWLDQAENSVRYQTNYNRFARRHPTGLKPYIGGVPVVG